MKSFVIYTLLFAVLSINASAQYRNAPDKPKLVLGIVVEGMRTDFIWRYYDKFEEGGFKRLISEGMFYKNASYDYLYPESSSAYATMATGANPEVHGIIGDKWYNQLKKSDIYCVEDKKQHGLSVGINSSKVSPVNLMCSTTADELRLSNFKQSMVYSISMQDYSAILSAGFSGNGAYWYNVESGLWHTGSYYQEKLPLWIERFNDKNLSSVYMDKTWDTYLSLTEYNASLGDDNDYEKGFHGNKHTFPYDLSQMKYKNGYYELIKSTPYGNTITRELAVSAIVNKRLGKDDFPDLLTVSFTSNADIAAKFGIRSVEVQDAYIRLDKELKFLLDFIDDYIGLQNVLVYLTSDGGTEDSPNFLADVNLPVHKFNSKGAVFLTQSYLKAIYDKSFLIEKFTKNGIYFDQDVVGKAGINPEELENKAAEFLIDFTGVSGVYTATALASGKYQTGHSGQARRQFFRKRSPDVLIEFKPGTIDSKGNFLKSGNRNYLHVPLIFYGWKVKPGSGAQKTSMTDLAPTLSTVLRISMPSASTGKPLTEITD
ncbi:MAG: alkaline phosphatase family protein [Bacteroidota bacterium]|nr:alkaline phosphatase family protein [Bacteroidota bacterium]